MEDIVFMQFYCCQMSMHVQATKLPLVHVNSDSLGYEVI